MTSIKDKLASSVRQAKAAAQPPAARRAAARKAAPVAAPALAAAPVAPPAASGAAEPPSSAQGLFPGVVSRPCLARLMVSQESDHA